MCVAAKYGHLDVVKVNKYVNAEHVVNLGSDLIRTLSSNISFSDYFLSLSLAFEIFC